MRPPPYAGNHWKSPKEELRRVNEGSPSKSEGRVNRNKRRGITVELAMTKPTVVDIKLTYNDNPRMTQRATLLLNKLFN